MKGSLWLLFIHLQRLINSFMKAYHLFSLFKVASKYNDTYFSTMRKLWEQQRFFIITILINSRPIARHLDFRTYFCCYSVTIPRFFSCLFQGVLRHQLVTNPSGLLQVLLFFTWNRGVLDQTSNLHAHSRRSPCHFYIHPQHNSIISFKACQGFSKWVKMENKCIWNQI